MSNSSKPRMDSPRPPGQVNVSQDSSLALHVNELLQPMLQASLVTLIMNTTMAREHQLQGPIDNSTGLLIPSTSDLHWIRTTLPWPFLLQAVVIDLWPQAGVNPRGADIISMVRSWSRATLLRFDRQSTCLSVLNCALRHHVKSLQPGLRSTLFEGNAPLVLLCSLVLRCSLLVPRKQHLLGLMYYSPTVTFNTADTFNSLFVPFRPKARNSRVTGTGYHSIYLVTKPLPDSSFPQRYP